MGYADIIQNKRPSRDPYLLTVSFVQYVMPRVDDCTSLPAKSIQEFKCKF